MLGRMRRRVLVAWLAQAALVLGLVLTAAVAAVVGTEDWSFVAVMAIFTAVGVGLWVQFEVGIPLVVVDLVYALVGSAITIVDAGGSDPAAWVRRVVAALWAVGGMVGVIALVLSTRVSGDPRGDIDTTAY